MADTSNLEADIKRYISPFKAFVKRRKSGMLTHDYLVPGGPYEEQWDWDAFFIGMALAGEISTEGYFLRNWALNYIENSRENGFTPGLVTPKGPDSRLNQMKPLLAQGCYFASRFMNDYNWLKEGERYERLKAIVLYRENFGHFDKELNLGAWTNSMESGADNNLAALDYPDGTVAAVDFNSFLYMEYIAMQKLAERLSKTPDIAFFGEKAAKLKEAIIAHLWNEEEGTYYNLDLRDRSVIKVVSYSAALPFWANIASQEQADVFFKRWLLHEEKMRSPHGIRTLSKDHPGYNNVNMIKPHSNWQGPLWPIATYIYCQSLMNYGYDKDAAEIAKSMIELCVKDIHTSGGMHENYDAETGLPLAAPNFVSWNLLLIDLPRQIELGENPFLLT